MLNYAVKRLALGLAIMVTTSIVIFVLTNVATDPAIAIAGENASFEEIASIRKTYGFDRPVHERSLKMLWDFARFDFGNSYFQDRPVIDLIWERLPVSVSLGLWTTLLTYLISIPLGIRKAVRAGSRFIRANGRRKRSPTGSSGKA